MNYEKNNPQKPPAGALPEPDTAIPKFDLAEEIMAQQRKIIAAKRKAPGKNNNNEQKSAGPLTDTADKPLAMQPKKYRIIADIVARDIEKLCGSNA